MEIVKELGNGRFVARNRKGEEIILTTIDKGNIEKTHNDDIRQIAETITRQDLENLIYNIQLVLNKRLIVDEWYENSRRISTVIKQLYYKVGKSSILYHSNKYINPDIYGKANTFKKYLEDLYSSAEKIMNVMKKMGKIENNINLEKKKVVRYEFCIPKDLDSSFRPKILDLLSKEVGVNIQYNTFHDEIKITTYKP